MTMPREPVPPGTYDGFDIDAFNARISEIRVEMSDPREWLIRKAMANRDHSIAAPFDSAKASIIGPDTDVVRVVSADQRDRLAKEVEELRAREEFHSDPLDPGSSAHEISRLSGLLEQARELLSPYPWEGLADWIEQDGGQAECERAQAQKVTELLAVLDKKEDGS
jgi:hypothetical protein